MNTLDIVLTNTMSIYVRNIYRYVCFLLRKK